MGSYKRSVNRQLLMLCRKIHELICQVYAFYKGKGFYCIFLAKLLNLL